MALAGQRPEPFQVCLRGELSRPICFEPRVASTVSAAVSAGMSTVNVVKNSPPPGLGRAAIGQFGRSAGSFG